MKNSPGYNGSVWISEDKFRVQSRIFEHNEDSWGTYRHADGDSPHLAKDFAPPWAEAAALVYPGVAVPGVWLVQNLGQEGELVGWVIMEKKKNYL